MGYLLRQKTTGLHVVDVYVMPPPTPLFPP